MKTVKQLLSAIMVAGILSACSTTPSSEADRSLDRKANRIADRMGAKN